MNEKESFCTNCGTPFREGDTYCSQCGAGNQVIAAHRQEELQWDANIPAGDLLWSAAKVLMIACGFVIVLIEVIMWFSGESFIVEIGRSIARGDSDIYYAGGFVGFFLLISAIVIWLIYRRGYEAEFGVGAEGVWMRTRPGTMKTNRVINGLLFWMSLLSGKPGGMGTAILADASQSGFFEWVEVHTVIADHERRIITLKNNWRSLVKLYCTADNYSTVLNTVEEYVKNYEPQRREEAATSPGASGYALKIAAFLVAIFGVVLIGQSPLLPNTAAVVILGVLVVAGHVFGGAMGRKACYLSASVLLGLAISMAINAFEPMGDYMVRYYRYDRLGSMPEVAEFAASLAGLVMVAALTWRNSRVKSE